MDTGMQTSTPAVECRGLQKSYGEGASQVFALRGIDLEVRRGEFLMLVGPSGCGKTTLISLMSGILDPSAGDCIVLGQNIQEMSDYDRTRFRGINIGFVFQQFNLMPTLTLRENVAIPLLLNGVAYDEALREADLALEQVELGNRSTVKPRNLSGGQQQRVAIARAIVHKPQVLVCDEPTSALDHVTGQHIMELLKSITAQHGRALVVVTHDSRIFQYADRIAEMDDGRVIRIQEQVAAAIDARSSH